MSPLKKGFWQKKGSIWKEMLDFSGKKGISTVKNGIKSLKRPHNCGLNANK